MSTDIFGTEQPAAPVQEQATPVATTTEPTASTENPLGHLLAGIKNERGEVKYNTVEDALTGAAHAQAKIMESSLQMKQLQEDLESARAEAAKYKSAFDVKDLLKPQTQEPSKDNSPVTPSGLSEEQTVALFQKLQVQQSQEATQSKNIGTVVQTLKEKYGTQANEVFYQRASEMGMSKDQMNTLAATSPAAALSFFEGVKAKELNPTTTSVNTTATPAKDLLNGPLTRGEKSMLLGASSDDLKNEMNRHKAAIYEKYGITA